jgi:hypothetical protein
MPATQTNADAANLERNQKTQIRKRSMLAVTGGMRYGFCDEVATKRAQLREWGRDLLRMLRTFIVAE